ncbi:LPP20 family lipoprotein [Paracoccaceae bacterium]|nr:LPP20 family lipoprotein [Paracoccaceae bacterium]
MQHFKGRNALDRIIKQTLAASFVALSLTSCDRVGLDLGSIPLVGEYMGQSNRSDDVETIESAVQATAAISQPKVKVVPTITGMGYASVASQPAKSVNQRRLMAIRAARLEAMRNLTEQVHGIRINSRTTIIDAIVQNDSLRATVDGLIVGAKTVRINPVGSDTYEVVLELDQALINTIMKAAKG